MAKQILAVFLACIIVVAAVQIEKAEAVSDEEYKNCYSECHKGCFNQEGNGYTFCEMKCDADCAEHDIKAALGI